MEKNVKTMQFFTCPIDLDRVSDVERVSGTEYLTRTDFLDDLLQYNKEVSRDDILIWGNAYDFMTACNDEVVDIDMHWVGVIYIEDMYA